MKPKIHLTNLSSTTQHGPGRTLSAMALPRSFEHGEGRVTKAAPLGADLISFKRGEIDVAEYQRRFELRCANFEQNAAFTLGRLMVVLLKAASEDGSPVSVPVADGDTLFCCCAGPDNPKRQHPCHLEWLAPFLERAGWDVVLYGRRRDNAQMSLL